ncbi:MAG TPA: SRPBCC family protein [Candidatus Eremiobacteraceae bacterium]|nr:SRPBCC family protein [Candidatus Eremiobacteraceae bacterium]
MMATEITGDRANPAAPFRIPNRRQVIAGIALTFGSAVAAAKAWGETQPQTMKETPSTAVDSKRTWLHQEVDFKTNPQRIYQVLLDAKQFAACTGMSAEIDPKAGGAFTTFGGLIVGRNIELIPNQRIVQAWRPTHWDPGVYSIVKFELKPEGSKTKIVLDHTGFPEGDFDSLNTGWKPRYWDPMKKFLA